MVQWKGVLETSSIAFLAVARIRDQFVLAERINKSTTDVEKRAIEHALSKLVQKLSCSKRLSRGEHHRCSSASFNGSVYAIMDPQGAFVVAVGVRDDSDQYPSHLAWELLNKFLSVVEDAGIGIVKATASDMFVLFKPMQAFMKSYSKYKGQAGLSQMQEKCYSRGCRETQEKISSWRFLKTRVKETLQKNSWRNAFP